MATKTKQRREWSRWVIVGACGLYVGQELTRARMIAQHTADIYGTSRYVCGGRLDDNQKRRWKQCQSHGDRAVRATLTLSPTKPKRKK